MAASAQTSPGSLLRRSFVYRKLVEGGASFEAVNGAAVAVEFGNAAAETETARRMGLADLSPLPRTGFKGAGTADWLAGQGLAVPDQSNRARRQSGGLLAARLAPGELLILGGLDGDAAPVEQLDRVWRAAPIPPETPRGFPVPRAHTNAWFRLSGSAAPAMFAKLCGVDLRAHKFADLDIAQTQIARLTGIIIRDDLGAGEAAVPAFHLIFDSASAAYLWDCLLDAMAEFDGAPVGLSALRDLSTKS